MYVKPRADRLGPTRNHASLTVKDAAVLAGVSQSTVRNWIGAKRIPFEVVDGAYRIDARGLRASKVFVQKHVLAMALQHGVEHLDLAMAIEACEVVPTSGPGRRFSMEDAEAMVSFKQRSSGNAPGQPSLPPKAGLADGGAVTQSGWHPPRHTVRRRFPVALQRCQDVRMEADTFEFPLTLRVPKSAFVLVALEPATVTQRTVEQHFGIPPRMYRRMVREGQFPF